MRGLLMIEPLYYQTVKGAKTMTLGCDELIDWDEYYETVPVKFDISKSVYPIGIMPLIGKEMNAAIYKYYIGKPEKSYMEKLKDMEYHRPTKQFYHYEAPKDECEEHF